MLAKQQMTCLFNNGSCHIGEHLATQDVWSHIWIRWHSDSYTYIYHFLWLLVLEQSWGTEHPKKSWEERKVPWIMTKKQQYTSHLGAKLYICFTQCMKFVIVSGRDVYALARKKPTANDCWWTPKADDTSNFLSNCCNYFNESTLGIEVGPIIWLIRCIKVQFPFVHFWFSSEVLLFGLYQSLLIRNLSLIQKVGNKHSNITNRTQKNPENSGKYNANLLI